MYNEAEKQQNLFSQSYTVNITLYHATSYSWPRGRTHRHTHTHAYIRREVMLRNQARAWFKNSGPKIQNIPISRLQKCYIRINSNKGDVMVSFHQSDILLIEVHSSYDFTANKTVHMLMEMLRMLKAFGVVQPTMDAFVFPRKECDRCVVKITMTYDINTVTFKYYITCIPIHQVTTSLMCAVMNNKAACQNLTNSPKLDYIIWLTADERNKWGLNFSLTKSGFGVLLMNNNVCLKKPIYSVYSESFTMLMLISKYEENSRIPNYKPVLTSHFMQYNKVRHDPLTGEEAHLCSLDLTRKMYEVIRSWTHA